MSPDDHHPPIPGASIGYRGDFNFFLAFSPRWAGRFESHVVLVSEDGLSDYSIPLVLLAE